MLGAEAPPASPASPAAPADRRGPPRWRQTARQPSQEAVARGPDGAPWTLRMREVCERTGLDRQVVHFYIREGLVPPGAKATRNSAFYGEVHVARLLLVRRLQAERFLPLRAIRAVLDGAGPFAAGLLEGDAPEPARWLREVKRAAPDDLARASDAPRRIPVAPLLAAHGVSPEDLAALVETGLLAVVEDPCEGACVAAEEAWLVETVGALRGSGFTEARGFSVRDLAMYEEAVSGLFERETRLLAERVRLLPAEEAGAMLARLLPLVNQLLGRYHEVKVRRLFSLVL
jgi:DNA-binding transcriptional MerR regulator